MTMCLRAMLCLGLMLAFIIAFSMTAHAATYYGIDDGYGYGDVTASGDPFDPWGSTAASLDIPIGTVVTFCAKTCEEVTVNDVGGGYGIEGLDVTKGVALRTGLI